MAKDNAHGPVIISDDGSLRIARIWKMPNLEKGDPEIVNGIFFSSLLIRTLAQDQSEIEKPKSFSAITTLEVTSADGWIKIERLRSGSVQITASAALLHSSPGSMHVYAFPPSANKITSVKVDGEDVAINRDQTTRLDGRFAVPLLAPLEEHGPIIIDDGGDSLMASGPKNLVITSDHDMAGLESRGAHDSNNVQITEFIVYANNKHYPLVGVDFLRVKCGSQAEFTCRAISDFDQVSMQIVPKTRNSKGGKFHHTIPACGAITYIGVDAYGLQNKVFQGAGLSINPMYLDHPWPDPLLIQQDSTRHAAKREPHSNRV